MAVRYFKPQSILPSGHFFKFHWNLSRVAASREDEFHDRSITGFFCCDDISAIQVMGHLREQGREVPDEVVVVSYGITAAAVAKPLQRFLGAGMIAFALIRWEIGGIEDEIDLLTTSRSR